MAMTNVYWTVTGITSCGIAVGLGTLLVAVSKMSIALGVLATMITVAFAAVAIPSTLAAQQRDAEAEPDVAAPSFPPDRSKT